MVQTEWRNIPPPVSSSSSVSDSDEDDGEGGGTPVTPTDPNAPENWPVDGGVLTVPDTVSIINSDVLELVPNIESAKYIHLPSSVNNIARGTFSDYPNLQVVGLKSCDNVSSIQPTTFQDCVNLTDVTLPESVTTIGMFAFKNCGKLNTINLDYCTKLSNIGMNAFEGCSALINITLPNSLKTIDESAFKNCSNLTAVDLSGCTQLDNIGADAFLQCRSLADVKLTCPAPGKLTIETMAFYSETATRIQVEIPANATENSFDVSTNAFSEDCTVILEFASGMLEETKEKIKKEFQGKGAALVQIN